MSETKKPARVVTYKQSRTGRLFHNSTAPIKGVMGPVGSGKSVICCWDIFYKSCVQTPDPRTKVRKSKWLIIRNTYGDLLATTIQTWLNWFPETKMHMSAPLTGILERPHPLNDGTTVKIELQFLALDKEEQVKHLKSLEVSGVWVNEASEMPWQFLSRAFERTGRYPPMDVTTGTKFKNLGMIMDTNPPSDTSWWYKFAEIEKPDNMAFFRQPPAVLKCEHEGKIWYEPNDGRNPNIPPAENVENHNEGWGYYMKQVTDGDHNRIKVFIMGEYGTTLDGCAVYPEYSDSVHYIDKEIEPSWGLPIFLGTDFGRTPCSVIIQMMPDGQIIVLDELCSQGMGITEFTREYLLPLLVNKYKFGQVRIVNFGDPAGADPNQIDDVSCIQVMNECGINTVPSPVPKNSFVLRRECIAKSLKLRVSGGKAGLVLTKNCQTLRSGFNGRYYYKKNSSGGDYGDEKVSASPEKNLFSHPHDALQYAVYGALHGGDGSYGSPQGGLWLPSRYDRANIRRSLNMNGFF